MVYYIYYTASLISCKLYQEFSTKRNAETKHKVFHEGLQYEMRLIDYEKVWSKQWDQNLHADNRRSLTTLPLKLNYIH